MSGKEKKKSKKIDYKWLLEFLIVMCIGTWILYEEYKVDKETLALEQKKSEIDTEQAAEEYKPNFQIEEKGSIPYGQYEYEKYIISNTGSPLSGGHIYLQAAVITWCGENIVKILAIDDAFFDNVPEYDMENEEISFLLWETDSLKNVEQTVERDVKASLGKKDMNDIEEKVNINLCIIAHLDYVTKQNLKDEIGYIIALEKGAACKRIKSKAYDYCDEFHIQRENIMYMNREDEYTKVVEEISERVIALEK